MSSCVFPKNAHVKMKDVSTAWQVWNNIGLSLCFMTCRQLHLYPHTREMNVSSAFCVAGLETYPGWLTKALTDFTSNVPARWTQSLLDTSIWTHLVLRHWAAKTFYLHTHRAHDCVHPRHSDHRTTARFVAERHLNVTNWPKHGADRCVGRF